MKGRGAHPGQPSEVNAPGHPGVRDYMLKYMGEQFVGNAFTPQVGHVAGLIISAVFGFLLLSAVNTAIVGSNGVMNRVSEDGILPDWFRHPHPAAP